MKLTVFLVIALSCLCSAQADQPKQADQPRPDLDRVAAIVAIRGLRDTMVDRESFRINRAVILGDGETFELLCTEYRSKNSAGGYVLGHYIFKKKRAAGGTFTPNPNVLHDMKIPESVEFDLTYSGYCATATDGRADVTDEVRAALKADRDKE
jgi:hypothetical protein